jgi:hypothetical protein
MSLFKNIVTLGAFGRIEEKMKQYHDLRFLYNRSYNRMENVRKELKPKLDILIQLKIKAINDLNKLQEFSLKQNNSDQMISHSRIQQELNTINYKKIDETLHAGYVALSLTAGVSTGISSAVGAWALVSSFGVASTGTAISSLAGIAATNATLAWFGGGAMAAGGGGMAAGSFILGGIAIIPAIAVMGVFNHLIANKKIKEIEKEMQKLHSYIKMMKRNTKELKRIKRRALKLANKIEKTLDIFNYEVELLSKKSEGKIRTIQWFYHRLRTIICGRSMSKVTDDLIVALQTPVIRN